MLSKRNYLAWISSAALIGLAACDKAETPTASEPGAATQSRDSKGAMEAINGRPATAEEIATLMANREKLPVMEAPATPSQGLAKSAAYPTCIIDFNQSYGLSLLPDHGWAMAATSPFYFHQCNSNFWVYTNPINDEHYHMFPEATDQCFGPSPKWGHLSNGACVNQSDAMYWPRYVSNHGGNTGVRFTVKEGYPNYYAHNFDLGAVYVKSGTMDLYAYRVGVGWWHWPNLTSAQRWYWTGNNLNISEVDIYANNLNGVVSWDNLEIAVR